MKLHLFLTSCLLSAATLVNLSPDLAQAGSPVQKVLSSEAQGLENNLRTITVWSGAGANLNFIPTGEIVKKVWLDDPSQIVLDFDGPMCTQAGDGSGDNCENSAATVVHLKRIHQIEFPNLPQTSSTLLSVVTQTSTGERKLYQFQIAYGTGSPQYHTVAIYPDSQVTPDGGMNGLVLTQLQNVELGLRVAKSRNLLGRNQGNQRLELRVQNFLDLVSSGVTPQSASQQAGVSMRLISKLASLGITSAAQQQAQLPARNQTENTTRISATPDSPTELPRKRSPNSATSSRPVSESQQPKVPINQNPETDTSRPKQPLASTSSPGARPQRQKTTTSVLSSASRTPEDLNVVNTSSVVQKPLLKQTSSRLPSRVIPQRRLIATATTDKSSATAPKYSQQAIDDANAAAFGLTVAKHKGQINTATSTYDQAQGAIRQLRLGKSREEAARRSGIDIATLNQLIKWGQNRP